MNKKNNKNKRLKQKSLCAQKKCCGCESFGHDTSVCRLYVSGIAIGVRKTNNSIMYPFNRPGNLGVVQSFFLNNLDKCVPNAIHAKSKK